LTQTRTLVVTRQQEGTPMLRVHVDDALQEFRIDARQ
jgi:hypothetical protein